MKYYEKLYERAIELDRLYLNWDQRFAESLTARTKKGKERLRRLAMNWRRHYEKLRNSPMPIKPRAVK